MDNDRWFLPAGTTGRGAFDVSIGPNRSDWRHTGLLVVTLEPGETCEIGCRATECMVVPLAGGGPEVTVTDAAGTAHRVRLTGRRNVFSGGTDTVYVPHRSSVTLTNPGSTPLRVALPQAVTKHHDMQREFRHVRADEVPTQLRGTGAASRLVRDLGTPDVLEADSLIVCEVITPGGNWSSWPPHKHDEDRPGLETSLEEIYYFEIASPKADGADPVGYQRAYGTPERPIEVLAEVRTGDVVLVPHGYHGPAMAPPGYDMYYLNVMAGPGDHRAWLIHDDPAHTWVRDTWNHQCVDPRLAQD